MKKAIVLVVVAALAYCGFVNLRIESPIFTGDLESLLQRVGIKEVDQPYNFVASHLPTKDHIHRNVVSYATVGAFLCSVVMLRSRGKSTKEAFKTAAFPATSVQEESHVVRKAKNKGLRTQLIAEQIGLENQLRKMPGQIEAAQKNVSWTSKHLQEAEIAYKKAKEDYDAAYDHNQGLIRNRHAIETDLAEINQEIDRVSKDV